MELIKWAYQKHDNMAQVINHLRKKLSSLPPDNRSVNLPYFGKIIPSWVPQCKVKWTVEGRKTLHIHMYLLNVF